MMTLRFSTTRAIGAAIALSLGSVASAAAQQPIPVRKDTRPATPAPTPEPMPAPMPAPARDTMATMPAPTPVMTDTTTTVTTMTTVSTGEVPMEPSMRRFGNGFYIGLAGGALFPQNNLNNAYRTGFGVELPIGWDPVNSPLGLRLNLGYNRLRADDRFDFNQSANGLGTAKDPQVYQAVVDAKLRLPFGKFLGSTSGLYAVGGGGAYYFRNYTNTVGLTTGSSTSVTNTFNDEDRTRFGANVGGGISWGLGRASLYVESRYVRVFTPNTDSDFVPVVVGLTFH